MDNLENLGLAVNCNGGERLVMAVLGQLEIDSLEELITTCSDIANYGIDGGYAGFSYYTDTIKFYDANERLILSLLDQYADEFGMEASDLVASFNCVTLDAYEVARFLRGDSDEDATEMKNALAWFAGEEVARLVNDKVEDGMLTAGDVEDDDEDDDEDFDFEGEVLEDDPSSLTSLITVALSE